MAASWIWDRYGDARGAFLEAAGKQDARLASEHLPGHSGPDGEPLCMDAAYLGADDPERLLLVLSGVHGFEGPAGSAVQTMLLRRAPRLARDTGALFIHAVNPYGFAHWSRATEDNIDLNRSFVDRSAALPSNPEYGAFHPYFCPDILDEAAIARTRKFIESYEAQFGAERASSAIGAGQYDHPDGLYYGGQAEPWSVAALFRLIDAAFIRNRLSFVALVDLHTGRGAYGEPFFVNFDSPDSQEFEQAAQWWGREMLMKKDELGSKYKHAGPPPRHGLVLRGIRRHLAPATLAGCVVEFGTYDLWTMYRAELADRWVRFKGKRNRQRAQELQAEAFRAFNPDDAAWRNAVLASGPQIVLDALAGLEAWTMPGRHASEDGTASRRP